MCVQGKECTAVVTKVGQLKVILHKVSNTSLEERWVGTELDTYTLNNNLWKVITSVKSATDNDHSLQSQWLNTLYLTHSNTGFNSGSQGQSQHCCGRVTHPSSGVVAQEQEVAAEQFAILCSEGQINWCFVNVNSELDVAILSRRSGPRLWSEQGGEVHMSKEMNTWLVSRRYMRLDREWTGEELG